MKLEDVARMIDPREAQLACANILRALGEAEDWSPETLDHATGCVEGINNSLRGQGIPSAFATSEESQSFWGGLK